MIIKNKIKMNESEENNKTNIKNAARVFSICKNVLDDFHFFF